MDKLKRVLESIVVNRLKKNPIVAIVGPRQCGKSTLAHWIVSQYSDAVYLDLEWQADRQKLQDPIAFFKLHTDKLICLDEIQRVVAELRPSNRR